MSDTASPFADWLTRAELPASRLTPEVRALLHAVFGFRQQQGQDYYCRRLLSHLLLHCGCGLKVARVARLTGLGPATASRHQGLSSKEVIQAGQRRLAGRPYGKLLPRYAGPVAQFRADNPHATHYDTLDFLTRTFGVAVSLQAMAHLPQHLWPRPRHTPRHARAGAAPAGPAPDPNGPDPPPVLVSATSPQPPARGRAVPLPPSALHFATTPYAGAFLLLPQALHGCAVANDCFTDD